MKNSMKILGAVLAVIMVCNIFAIGTLAAPAEGGAIKLMLSTDKATYAPGEDIVITFSEQVVSAVGPMRASGQYEIAYNSSVIQPLNDKVKASEYGGFKDLAGDAAIDNCKILFANACVGNGSSILDSDASAYGWNEQIGVLYMHSDGKEFDATTSDLKLFTLTMKISDTAAAGTYTIGFNQGGYEGYSAYSNDVAMGGVYGYTDDLGYGTPTNYDCGVVTFTVGGEGGGSTGPTEPTEPTATLANLDPRVQWKESGSNVICIGFEGQITGEAIVVDDVVNSKIAEIGFEFSTTDNSLNGATKVKVDKIYDFTGNTPNTYKFRAVVVKAMSAADATDPDEGGYTHNLYARAYVTIGDKTTYATDIIETTVYDEYSEGVASGLATLAANLG